MLQCDWVDLAGSPRRGTAIEYSRCGPAGGGAIGSSGVVASSATINGGRRKGRASRRGAGRYGTTRPEIPKTAWRIGICRRHLGAQKEMPGGLRRLADPVLDKSTFSRPDDRMSGVEAKNHAKPTGTTERSGA